MTDVGLALVAGIVLCAFGHWIFGGLLILMALAGMD